MKKIFLLFLFISSRIASQTTDSLKTINSTLHPTPRILIINSFDAETMHYRKNKKELFKNLTDSLQFLLTEQIKTENLGEPIIIPQLIPSIFDSKALLDSLFLTYNAGYAIVIKQLNAFFEQTNVEVSRDDFDGNKKREASYDICSEVNYAFYKPNDKPYHSKTRICDPFTTRNVVSGLLAGGPDIVGKSKHAFKIIEKNAKDYVWEIGYRLK